MDIKDIKFGNGIFDQIVQKYTIIEIVDKEAEAAIKYCLINLI